MDSVAVPIAARNAHTALETAFTIAGRVSALRAQGRDIADLSIGEPDLPTPDFIVEAGLRALAAGATRYGPPAGLPALRAAIAAAAGADAADVFVTPGAKAAMLYSLLVAIDPGDEVLVPDPGFPPYRSQVRLAGGVPVPYRLARSSGFALTAGAIAGAITPRSRAIIVNDPGNPAGGALDAAEGDAIAELAARHGLLVLSDEIYAPFAGDTPRRIPTASIMVNALSKSHRMTGWRLGWAVVPASHREAYERIVVNAHSCVAPFVQLAAVAAIERGDAAVRGHARELEVRRQRLAGGLDGIPGIRCPVPAGGFYVFPDCTALLRTLGVDDAELAHRLLDEAGVAAIAGSSFGENGRGHLRLSLAASRPVLETALERIAHFATHRLRT